MPKKQPRYSPDVQRSAVEQVLHHHIPIAQVARQLHCSDQSLQRWMKLHRNSLTPPTTFLPIRVDSPPSPSPNIELITNTGLTLRLPGDTSADTLIKLVRSLEGVSC